MTYGSPVIYRPARHSYAASHYRGEFRGTTKTGRIRVQITHEADGTPLRNPWQVITKPTFVFAEECAERAAPKN